MNRRPRTLIYGFHESSLAAAIDEVEREGLIEVVHWVGVTSPDRKFDDDIQQWHLNGVNYPQFSGRAGADLNASERILAAHREQIVDQLRRNPVCESLPSADYPEFIAKLVVQFENLLCGKDVELLVFQNLPHEGFELVLYLVGKQLGIRTLLTYQSILPNRFFYCYELDDFGWFRQVPPSLDPVELDVPRQFHKDLFYMRGVAESLKNTPRTSILERLQRRLLFAKISFKLWKQRLGWYKFWNLSPPRIPPHERYAWEAQRAIVQRTDLNVPFVYFPLHLQPELTTSAIGDQYSDQVCAIEDLSRWIPEGWRIYVKENPKQTFRFREPQFFERLLALCNVKLIDRSIDTYLLLSHCRFAATITGTVGWESITGGKSVIVFGRPWYLTLPGVHKWPVTLPAEEIATESIDHETLTAAVRQLLRKSALGVVDIAYRATVPDFTSSANSQLVANFLRQRVSEPARNSKAREWR